MSLYSPPETLKIRNKEKSKESSTSATNQALELQNVSEPRPPKRDPHDTLEIVYNWHSSTFSYKRLSKVDKYANGVPIPRFTKKVRLAPWGANFESSRMVELPRKVYFERNLLRRFGTVWIEDGDRHRNGERKGRRGVGSSGSGSGASSSRL